MAIEKGARVPDGTLVKVTGDGPDKVSAAEFFGGRTVVLFGVPGAFTPTCHNKHMPPFVAKSEELKAKGVAEIAAISVNDHFVMDEWRKSSDTMGRVTFLADGNGDYTRALGMELDATGAGLGMRSKRYVALVEDGTVTFLGMEDSPGDVTESGVDTVLAALDGK